MRIRLLFFAAILFHLPLASAQEQVTKPGTQLTIDDLRTFTDVFNQLRTNFVEEVDDHTLLNAAINGMIKELDSHSAFLDLKHSRELEEASNGRYGGIGIRADINNGRIVISQVTPGGPADKAGVMVGDLVTAVAGRPVRERKIFESLDALKGEPGSSVEVRFKSGSKPSRDMELVREFIHVSTISYKLLDGGFGYYQISHFNQNSRIELEDEILTMQEAFGSPLKGIILDLRNNFGGVVQPAVEIADGFLDEGLIMKTRGRYEATKLEFNAEPGQWIPDIPLVLLVNGNTASASEVLTGALKDHDRAVVIGEPTFGKGSIQSIFNLRNGSALKLTTAYYFTPSGIIIHNNGIEPHILMKSPHQGLDFVTSIENDPLIVEALNQLADAIARDS